MTVAILKIPGTNIRNILTALPDEMEVVQVLRPEDLPVETSWIILPGVGHFGSYMKHLEDFGWSGYLHGEEFNTSDQKLLGVCSGFHACCQSSEEATGISGLGLFEASVEAVPLDLKAVPPVKSPNVGRQQLSESKDKSLPAMEFGFFTHSFGVKALGQASELQNVPIGNGIYVAFMKSGKIHGVQHHPELSGEVGRQFFRDLLK